jgi:uncharacterized protein (DUF952 family)
MMMIVHVLLRKEWEVALINGDAVLHTYDFELNDEGRFSLPADLEKMQ